MSYNFKQYIPVKAGGGDPSEPDWTQCPLHGYIVDPNLNPPVVPGIDTQDPILNEIILLCSDGGDRKIAFTVGGNYNVEILGANGVFFTQSKLSNNIFVYTFPPEEAYLNTYQVRIFSTANNITSFSVSQISGNAVQNWKILEAKFNTPYLTTLNQSFYNITDLVSIQFHSDINLVTTLQNFAYGTRMLEWCSFKNMNALSGAVSAFQNSGIKYVTFPTTLPALTSLYYAFSACNRLEQIKYPDSMPLLNNMSSTHQGNTVLSKVTLPTSLPKLSVLSSTFGSCGALKSIVFPSSLPELTQMGSTFSYCSMLSNVTMPTTAPKLNTLSYTFNYCYALPNLVFPNSLPLLGNMDGTFSYCSVLKSVNIPSDSVLISSMSATFRDCYLLSNMVLPATMNSCANFTQTFLNAYSLATVTLPTAISNTCNNMQSMFESCRVISNVVFPPTANGVTNMSNIFGSSGIISVTLPQNMNACTNAGYAFSSCTRLQAIIMPLALPAITYMFNFVNSQAQLFTMSACTFGTNIVNADQIASNKFLTSFNYPTMRVSRLYMTSGAPASSSVLQTLEIDWINSPYSGTSPQINITYLNWTAAQINALFTKLPVVSGKSIAISGATGYATCDKTIATAKGWIVS